MQEIRTSADKRRRENPEIEAEIQRHRQFFQPVHSDPRFHELDLNLRQANLAYNAAQLPAQTRFSYAKRIVLRLISPYTSGQVKFNAALVRAFNKAWEIIQEQHKTIDDLRREQLQIVELIRTFNDFFHEDQRKDVIRRLTTIYEESRNVEVRSTAEENRRILQTGSLPAGFDYLMFQDRFRGSEAEVKERQRKYLQYFEHREPVLDIACGRGEFLELLRESGVRGVGVEKNQRMVDRCLEKGLSVAAADLFDHLEGLEDESLGGIFAAQLIEHFHCDPVFRLIALASVKLKTGGVLVLETVNPASLFVFAHSLYLDPTHARPYHPLSLKFICENLGFPRTEVVFGSPVEEDWKLPPLPGDSNAALSRALQRVNDLLYGPQDYALVAYK